MVSSGPEGTGHLSPITDSSSAIVHASGDWLAGTLLVQL